MLSNNNCADIMPSLYVKNGEAHIAWMSNSGNAIPITRQDSYINHVSGVSAGKDIYLTFKRDRTEFNNDAFDVNSDICVMDFSDYTDMELEELSLDRDEVVHGEEISLNVTCKNVGMQNVNSYILEVKAGTEVIDTYTSKQLLEKGQSNEHIITCAVPENIARGSQISVNITCESDENLNNNSKSIDVGYPDLKLSVHKFDSENKPVAELYVEVISESEEKYYTNNYMATGVKLRKSV